jgi:hypothetical protein
MLRAAACVGLIYVLAGCGVALSRSASLPNDFPADFPTPPNARLILATGPLPFVPAEAKTMTAQWSSTLSKDDLAAFYARPHGTWVPYRTPIEGPSAGPLTLGRIFLLTHAGDGVSASVTVGMTNTIDTGTLVQATILPPRPTPSPTAP